MTKILPNVYINSFKATLTFFTTNKCDKVSILYPVPEFELTSS